MILPLQNFTTIVQNMSAALQGSAAQVVDLSVGSVLRALLEANASVALWMQWLILQVLSMTRAATSVGADLDSWMADFSLVRLPGAPSQGNVTFGRYTTGLTAMIPVGTIVRTVDGSGSFVVVADLSNPAWNGQTGYLLPSNISTITLPIQALTAGLTGNVVAGAIGLLGSALPGVDYVVNSTALTNGVDAESDVALRTRFQLYVNSRSLATVGAVGAAVQSLQQGLRYCVLENVDSSGGPAPGNFRVIVDNGAGIASPILLAAVSAAVDLIRPIGSTYSVSGPVDIIVAIQMSLVTSNSLSATSVATLVQQAILTWIQGLPMGAVLAISKLEAIAHATDISVVSVTDTIINGLGINLTANPGAVFVAGPIDVIAV